MKWETRPEMKAEETRTKEEIIQVNNLNKFTRLNYYPLLSFLNFHRIRFNG